MIVKCGTEQDGQNSPENGYVYHSTTSRPRKRQSREASCPFKTTSAAPATLASRKRAQADGSTRRRQPPYEVAYRPRYDVPHRTIPRITYHTARRVRFVPAYPTVHCITYHTVHRATCDTAHRTRHRTVGQYCTANRMRYRAVRSVENHTVPPTVHCIYEEPCRTVYRTKAPYRTVHCIYIRNTIPSTLRGTVPYRTVHRARCTIPYRTLPSPAMAVSISTLNHLPTSTTTATKRST